MSDLARYEEEIAPERSQLDSALNQLRAFTVQNEEGLNWAAGLLLNAKGRAQDLEARRKEITGPILLAKNAIDGLFKPVIERYEQAEAILKGKIADWTNQVEAQRRAAMVASAAEYQAGGTPTAIIPEPVKVSGITVGKVWDFEITDAQAVPRDFCVPEPKLIRIHIKAAGTETPADIPGVRFFQKDKVSARTGNRS